MRLPISWLKTYLPKLPPTPKLVETLMMHGLDVERTIDQDDDFDHIVVGEIVGIRPHPNADKLRLTNVIITPKGEPQEIVCGAPNIEVGQKVPVALIGAKLPNGLTIELRSIRGVVSNGMLCAQDELGLGSDHRGIMILDPKSKIGTPLAGAIGADQTMLDVATPANRADLMAMRGLAWEIGVILGQTPKFPPVTVVESTSSADQSVTLKIADQKFCTLLTARVIRGVGQPPTPLWMVSRLRAAGMRSINIVADITNYIMLEYGQPLHAYDAARVHGHTLTARLAKSSEQLKTLDGKVRTLTTNMLVIADADRAIGLAGVMGGEETEVTASTTDIILEAAIFDPVSIRRTSRQLGLVSEASRRFEKGLWPSLPEQASAAAAALIVELCGGTIERGSVRVGAATSPRWVVTLNPAYVTERLGMKVPAAKSKSVLKKLGFTVNGPTKSWTVSVPDWRLDVTRPEDIVDEIGRMVGYEQLPKVVPSSQPVVKELPPMVRFAEEVKNVLVDMGFTEVISHAFYGDNDARMVKGSHFEVANPLDATQHQLRKSLLPQINHILTGQADAGRDAELFELGSIFDPDQSGPVERQQSWKVALGVTHKGNGILKNILRLLQQRLLITTQPESFLVAPDLVRGRMIEFCEFDLREMMAASKADFGPWDPNRHIAHHVKHRQHSKYPAVRRDIAFWWPHDEMTVRETIAQLEIPLLNDFKIKDRFTKNGQTSFAVTFVYQSPERTLTKAEVDTLEAMVKEGLVKQGAIIR